jgi:hypothetical protein
VGGALLAASCSAPGGSGDPGGAARADCPVYKCPPPSVAAGQLRSAAAPACGRSGAVLGARTFHELDANVKLAVDGLRITAFEDAQKQPLTLVIDGDELTARDSTGAIRRGSELDDSYLYLVEEPSKVSPPAQYYLHLTGAGTTPFWVGGGLAHAYRFTYLRLGDSVEQPLCQPPVNRTPPLDEKWNDLADRALVFGTDHYDELAKTVAVQASTRFNLACAGTSFATMHLTRHTTAGSDAGHTTTREQRQAMFKMLYADYCGTGRSFTWDDYPVDYSNATGWYSTPGMSSGPTYEAIWNEFGAVCLDVPRLEGAADGIDVRIRDECKKVLPPCTKAGNPSDISGWWLFGYVLSAIGDTACPLPPLSVP